MNRTETAGQTAGHTATSRSDPDQEPAFRAEHTSGWKHKIRVLAGGLLAGLVAALTMTFVMVVARFTLGLASPAELIGDRIAPTLGIGRFFELLSRFGGYNQLKQLGISSVLAGQLIFGTLGGAVYAVVVERGRAKSPARLWRFGISRRGRLLAGALVAIAWLVSVVLLWPVLGTNYRGLPPGRASIATAAGLLLGYTSYGVALMLSYRLLTSRDRMTSSAPLGSEPVGRRAFLAAGAALALAAGSGALISRLYQLATFSYDGTRYEGPDIQAIVPNDAFYVVTKNVVDPSIAKPVWRLEIGGLVDRSHTYGFAELAALPAVTQETTLTCISNAVGGGLTSNALWKGVPLRSLLEAAGPRSGAVEVVLHGADGYTDTFALEKALEPTTLVVYEMNGEPLPERHGYPARVLVPGLYGEKNVKWVTRVELVDHDAKGFYEQQGWGPTFVVQTQSRFHGPDLGRPMPAGTPIMFTGTAFAGNRGVARVEVSPDDGQTWHEARFDSEGPPQSWRLWSYRWLPPRPGEYNLMVRATDGTGTLQTAKQRGIAPEGATGYHRITVRIVA
ncbi:MAG TPA: molybdopterin-dependent oxidoreductase [Herpetosiphonaceae bacterium]|nr:molybdopterin-dependent oxidoreductase [Herpetosiphonaceae bacterium]